MTDEEAMDLALSAVNAGPVDHRVMRRNGRMFLALPRRGVAALHTLWLYQPQRRIARWAASAMQFLALTGLHRLVLPRFVGAGGKTKLEPENPSCLRGTAGAMLGSPEHRIRRAIVSYETSDGWEVAKLAFGPEGRRVIEGEAAAIREMPTGLPGIPRVLGVHHGPGFTMLRMPYEKGSSFTPRDTDDAIRLLDAWIPDLPALEITCFPEWPMIEGALEGFENRQEVVTALAAQRLVSMMRHGDFARWNLIRRRDGSVVVLDWEWGNPAGMPGLDLVHFILQDARLVARMEALEAIGHTMDLLARPPFCDHLRRCGWVGSPLLPILASLAWKQGAGHQDNAEILKAALSMAERTR